MAQRSVCLQLRHVCSLPLCFKHEAISREGAASRLTTILSEVMYISCVTDFVLTALLSVSALLRAVPGSSIHPDSYSGLNCVLKERVNEVKINEARERRHIKAVRPSMPHL